MIRRLCNIVYYLRVNNSGGLYSMQVAQRCRAMGQYMFHKHLFITNVGISITLSGVGDILQQHYEILKGTEEKWNHVRTFHMSMSGMTVGIICHHTYNLMDHFLPGRTLVTVMKKVLVDQLIMSPVLITVFLATIACLKRSNWETFLTDLKYKGIELYIADWVIWPPAQIINFYFLPTRFRVLYDNTISLGFDVYSSYITHKQRPDDTK